MIQIQSLDERRKVHRPGRMASSFMGSFRRPLLRLHNSHNDALLLLLGVDHASSRSSEFVRSVVRSVRPDCVAVELCEARVKGLLSGKVQFTKLRLQDLFKLKGSLTQRIITFLSKNLYADLAAKGFEPGQEFKAAIEEGRAFGAKVYTIDQDIDQTLRRASEHLYLKEVWRFFVNRKGLSKEYPHLNRAFAHEDINDSVEELMNGAALDEIFDFGEKFFPGLVKTMLHERNEIMVKHLREMEGTIVGVVGALHVRGMERLWLKAEGRPVG